MKFALTDCLPVLQWFPRYKPRWLINDILAAITVTMLVIPQTLSYARLAKLPVEYGLYSAFVGGFIYVFIGTSKDINIGPTALSTLLVAQSIANNPSVDPVLIITTTSFLLGITDILLGVFQLGILIEFISMPVIAGFTTGAAIQIICSQLPAFLGLSSVKSHESPIIVLTNVFRHLNETSLDAAFGFGCFAILLLFRFLGPFMAKRKQEWFVFVGYASNAIALIVMTIISLCIKGQGIKIIGYVPSGFNHIKFPSLDNWQEIIVQIPGFFIVGALEHFAICKTYGRMSNYQTRPNQELLAIGLTNLAGSFFGGFASTGSFSRSAVNSYSGVMTPLSGVFEGSFLVLIIYCLTGWFYYIPNAALAAVIINSVLNLISSISFIYSLYRTSWLDGMTFLIAKLVTLLVSIQAGVFSAVLFSIFVLLVKIARPYFEAVAHDIEKSAPGLFIVRIKESLLFPNSDYLVSSTSAWFKKHVKTDLTPSWSSLPSEGEEQLYHIIFDFSCVNQMDSSGLQFLKDLKIDLEASVGHSIDFYFCHVRSHIKPVLDRFFDGMKIDKEEKEELLSDKKLVNHSFELPEFIFDSEEDILRHLHHV